MMRLLMALGLATLLSGCFQAEMKIEILSPEDGQATTTIEMSRANYANFGANGNFCDDGELSLSDDLATCITVNGGTIDEMIADAAQEGKPVPLTILDNGTMRVVFPISAFTENVPNDPQTIAMMGQLLIGSTVTVTIVGKKILETNMELAADGKSASYTMDTLVMLQQSDTLPAELFAIVDPN